MNLDGTFTLPAEPDMETRATNLSTLFDVVEGELVGGWPLDPAELILSLLGDLRDEAQRLAYEAFEYRGLGWQVSAGPAEQFGQDLDGYIEKIREVLE